VIHLNPATGGKENLDKQALLCRGTQTRMQARVWNTPGRAQILLAASSERDIAVSVARAAGSIYGCSL
jgi:hypothetical protein